MFEFSFYEPHMQTHNVSNTTKYCIQAIKNHDIENIQSINFESQLQYLYTKELFIDFDIYGNITQYKIILKNQEIEYKLDESQNITFLSKLYKQSGIMKTYEYNDGIQIMNLKIPTNK